MSTRWLHEFKWVVNSLLFWVVDSLVLLSARKGKGGGVAVVRLDNIGDFVLWIEAAGNLRGYGGVGSHTLVCNALCSDMARGLSYWDNVISVDIEQFRHNLLYRAKILRRIRQANFDITLQPTYSRAFRVGDAIVRASGAARRIGSMGDVSNSRIWEKIIADRWYTELVSAEQRLMSEFERDKEFVVQLKGVYGPGRMPLIPLLQVDIARFKLPERYVVVFPGASWDGRCWSAERFGMMAQKMVSQWSMDVVVCGSMEDLVRCDEVADSIDRQVINLAGRTTLSQLVEIIRGSALLLSNDTSAVHIAAAVGTESVCILGGGHYGRFLPYPEEFVGSRPTVVNKKMDCYGCNWECIYPRTPGMPVRCIDDIDVDEVWAAIAQAHGLRAKPLGVN